MDGLRTTRNNLQKCPYIERISQITYKEFFEKYLLPNKPCIFTAEFTTNWKSRREWVSEGQINFDHLDKLFGESVVPIANCNKERYSSHPKEDKTFSDFIQYWRQQISQDSPSSTNLLYLKDWHFNKVFPSYNAYETPVFFTSDWLNEFWDSRTDDDYRFVYMGPKGTWTPFHADVFRSYSWSANISGKKQWILFPPGEEKCLTNRFGQLVFDVNSEELNDEVLYPQYRELRHRLTVTQEVGEIIFVPSGWHHQVCNLEDTISINHNWMNGCNIDICWEFIKASLVAVQQEISDCQDMEGWHTQCQLILKASSGIDYSEFFSFMETIARNRIQCLLHQKQCDVVTKDERLLKVFHLLEGVEGENSHYKEVNMMQCNSNKEVNLSEYNPEMEVIKSQSKAEEELKLVQCLSEEEVTLSKFNLEDEVANTGNLPSCSSDSLVRNVVYDSDISAFSSIPSDLDPYHWWHMVYDLNRIQVILQDMLKVKEVADIENGNLLLNIKTLSQKITNIVEVFQD